MSIFFVHADGRASFTSTNTTIEIIVSMTYSIWNVEGFCGQGFDSCFWRRSRKQWQVIYVKSAMGKMASRGPQYCIEA